jgi:hypothetical protein
LQKSLWKKTNQASSILLVSCGLFGCHEGVKTHIAVLNAGEDRVVKVVPSETAAVFVVDGHKLPVEVHNKMGDNLHTVTFGPPEKPLCKEVYELEGRQVRLREASGVIFEPGIAIVYDGMAHGDHRFWRGNIIGIGDSRPASAEINVKQGTHFFKGERVDTSEIDLALTIEGLGKESYRSIKFRYVPDMGFVHADFGLSSRFFYGGDNP